MPPDQPLTPRTLLADVFRQFSRNLLAVGVLEGLGLLSIVVLGMVFFMLSEAPSPQMKAYPPAGS